MKNKFMCLSASVFVHLHRASLCVQVSLPICVCVHKQTSQDDRDKLVKWSEKWQALFNVGVCNFLHLGHGNTDEEYKMGDSIVGRTMKKGSHCLCSRDSFTAMWNCGFKAFQRSQNQEETKLIVFI